MEHKNITVEEGDISMYKHSKKKKSILTDTPFSPLLFEDLKRKGRMGQVEEMFRKEDVPKRLAGGVWSPYQQV